MRRPRKLAFEPLEGKTLLAAFAVPVAPAPPPIPVPMSQGLVVTLTTNHRVYRPGQPVVVTLTETNTSQHDVSVFEGPSAGGLIASRGGRRVWTSNPGIQPMFVLSQTLQPGQSITRSVTWNGQANLGARRAVSGHVAIGSEIQGAPHVNIVILRS